MNGQNGFTHNYQNMDTILFSKEDQTKWMGVVLFTMKKSKNDFKIQEIRFKLIKKRILNFNSVSTEREYKTDNIGLCCIFESLETKKSICIINVHLYWDPNYDNVKISQSIHILQFIKENIEEDDMAIIICGDFNSLPESQVYLNLSESFKSVNHKNEPEFTNFTKEFQGTLDYIFLNSKLKVNQILENVSTEKLKNEIALPNSYFPSDHLAVYCEVIFNEVFIFE
jgi:CCR4-NOT transcription complex subunit 6